MRSGTTSTGEPTSSRTSTNSIPKLDAVGALTLRPLLTRKLVSGRRSRERGRCGARAWGILAGLISARRCPVTVRFALPSQKLEWDAYLCESSTTGQGDKGEWRKRSCRLPGLRCPDCGAQIAVPRTRLSSRARSAWRRSASCGAYLCEASAEGQGDEGGWRVQRDKVMADAQHEGREFSPVASAWCASACRCFLTGSHNGGFSSAGHWSVVWMKMVLRSLSKANEGFLCSEGCYVQRAAGLLCNVRALAFRLISRSEPSRLRPLLDGM